MYGYYVIYNIYYLNRGYCPSLLLIARLIACYIIVIIVKLNNHLPTDFLK